jgi:hypothetical protein
MKKGIILTIICLLIGFIKPLTINSQEDELLSGCKALFKAPFIITDSSFKALLTGEEVAEFKSIFFSGTIYRLVSCGYESENVEFTVLDANRNILFESANYQNVELWDFKMEGSMECIIEARLNTEKVQSGMIFMLLGFKSSNPLI